MQEFDDLNDLSILSRTGLPLQSCPKCGATIGAMPGGRDAVCKNCLPALLRKALQAGGYKDPCCE